MQNRRNYYRLLQVQPDAAADVIKASYRTLMQKLRFHPDLGGDEWNASLLNEAYTVLSDPLRRSRYDALLEAQRTALGARARNLAGAPPPSREPAAPAGRPGAARAAAERFESLTCPLCRIVTDVPASLPQARRCRSCDSPLSRVSAGAAVGPGERAVPRLERQTRVRFARVGAAADLRVHHALAQDLSSQGMRFVTAEPLVTGELLRLECPLLSAVARVVTCREQSGGAPGHSVGVAFVTAEFHRQQGSLVATEA